jgi:hypothetical protein
MPKKEQLRAEDLVNELDGRIRALSHEEMLDTSEEDAEMLKASRWLMPFTKPSSLAIGRNLDAN